MKKQYDWDFLLMVLLFYIILDICFQSFANLYIS